MAYLVMAYIIMAYAVMAYGIIGETACAAMADIVMAHTPDHVPGFVVHFHTVVFYLHLLAHVCARERRHLLLIIIFIIFNNIIIIIIMLENAGTLRPVSTAKVLRLTSAMVTFWSLRCTC